MLSRRSSTSSEKKRGKSMTRSKSPFRSFRFKKSKAPAAAESGAGDLDDDDNLRTIGKMGRVNGSTDFSVTDSWLSSYLGSTS